MPATFEQVYESYRYYLENEKVLAARSVKDYLEGFQKIQNRIDLLKEPSYKEVNDVVRQMKLEMDEEARRKGSPNPEEATRATHYKLTICLRVVARWLVREEYTSRNVYPFSEWRKPRPKTPKFLRPDEFEKLIDDPMLSHQEETMLFLFWDSAGRLGEVAALTQKDFFFDQKFFLDEARTIEVQGHYVRISWEISKGHYSNRNVPITDRCKEALVKQFGYARRRGHDKAIILGADNQAMTKSGISKVLHNIGMRYSPFRPIMHLSAQMFRHSFGIRMLEKGVPELIVQKLLGHDSLDMTTKYTHMVADNAMRIFAQRGIIPIPGMLQPVRPAASMAMA